MNSTLKQKSFKKQTGRLHKIIILRTRAVSQKRSTEISEAAVAEGPRCAYLLPLVWAGSSRVSGYIVIHAPKDYKGVQLLINILAEGGGVLLPDLARRFL